MKVKIIAVSALMLFAVIMLSGAYIYYKAHKVKDLLRPIAIKFSNAAFHGEYKITPCGSLDYGGTLDKIIETRNVILAENNCSLEKKKWEVKFNEGEIIVFAPTEVLCPPIWQTKT